MPRNAEATRARILNAAHQQFFRKGFARVKMNDIASAAKVTKRTLYHHYTSKDQLLEAMLEHQHVLSAATYLKSFADADGGAESLVRRLFADLESWANTEYFLGSGFTRLASELADLPGHPAMRFARLHKATLENHLAEVLAARGVSGADQMARELWILIEGAMIMTLVHGGSSYIRAGADAATKLVLPGQRGS